jgi:hypothetical protein
MTSSSPPGSARTRGAVFWSGALASSLLEKWDEGAVCFEKVEHFTFMTCSHHPEGAKSIVGTHIEDMIPWPQELFRE